LLPVLIPGEPGRPRFGLALAAPAAVPAPWDPARQGIFPRLVAELAGAVGSPRGLFRCSRCGTAVPAEGDRVPRRDRQQFCSDACRHDAKRDANRASERRRYARKKAATPNDSR